ncbi:MAG TPA: hypothetical protein VFC46_09945 [Humisphaera sp.]|nr:hypothetical protein [Humisphaera sp.]
MLTIEVDGQLEERLTRAAESAGAAPQAIARRVLEENLPRPNAATLALLNEWEHQNSTTDIAELKLRNEESERFMAQLDRNRTESEGPHARKLWP